MSPKEPEPILRPRRYLPPTRSSISAARNDDSCVSQTRVYVCVVCTRLRSSFHPPFYRMSLPPLPPPQPLPPAGRLRANEGLPVRRIQRKETVVCRPSSVPS